ncbi:uncharacterized protein M421DRAFT_258354 [Didymella exigua CBS 183.55]|uniref:Uncharacterized protein n=1 Tax=Didymella exigua CBS 183.55 TaxID=1150837 RepID=A0A6A5RAL2_9PLEO|nr:uncharacterized protein M421DRAFT_258354 [Didymella exigua CBS 183.55]KAF1925285.1 hypothetical protein M421DRAFT_258354 [Didymella exigua CBS 183.55]
MERDLGYNPSQVDFTVIAEKIMCAYPISDIYAPTPRYLYYALLLLTFATLRFRWLSNIFLTGAVAYAASAAIHAFIIVSSPPRLQQPNYVNLPFVPDTSSLTESVVSLITGVPGLLVQPDAVELDIDPITAVVVTAYLVGLPLQIWSRTMRSSLIVRYMILLWNLCMLAGTISALLAWPSTNLTAPQFRFCFAGNLDGDSQGSDGWDPTYWKRDWNSTIWNIFGNPDTVWQQLSNSCFYPCFNTSQVIRQSTSLKAVVTTPTTKFAMLHNAQHGTDDEFKPLIYVLIVVFSAAQFFLYIVSVMRLGSEAMRVPIHEPHSLWRNRKTVGQQLRSDMLRSWTSIRAVLLWPSKGKHQQSCSHAVEPPAHASSGPPHCHNFIATLRLIVDVLAILTLLAGIIISPLLVIAFIWWIEWYIRNDGSTNESISQVGQWSPLVSVAVVLFAALVYQLKGKLASESEIRDEICKTEMYLRKLKVHLEEKNST